MEYLEEYRDTLEQVENLDEHEGLDFMWKLNGLLTWAYEQSETTEERTVYHHFSNILEEAEDHHELTNRTEDLHTEYYTHGNSKSEYVEDVVTGLYQKALEQTL